MKVLHHVGAWVPNEEVWSHLCLGRSISHQSEGRERFDTTQYLFNTERTQYSPLCQYQMGSGLFDPQGWLGLDQVGRGPTLEA